MRTLVIGAGGVGDERFGATQLDASDPDAIVALAEAERADTILCAVDPWLNPPAFAAAAHALEERDPANPLRSGG